MRPDTSTSKSSPHSSHVISIGSASSSSQKSSSSSSVSSFVSWKSSSSSSASSGSSSPGSSPWTTLPSSSISKLALQAGSGQNTGPSRPASKSSPLSSQVPSRKIW